MSRHRIAAAVVVVVGAALLAACTSGSGDRSSSGSVPGAAAASRAAGGAAAAPTPVEAKQGVRLAAPDLVITGSVTLSVHSNAAVDVAATRATGIADAAGGRVDADSRSSGTAGSAILVLRVPNAALSAVSRQLAALGKVTTQNLQTKDVTSEVADVDSRVTSARAAIAGLNRLYARAATVRDLITVESALASRQSDLESLEAQQRTLAGQTALATLTVSIEVRVPPPAAKHHHRSGFLGGLHDGWQAFTSTAHAVATAAGVLLPFAVLALLVGAAGVTVVRRRKAPRPEPSVDPAS